MGAWAYTETGPGAGVGEGLTDHDCGLGVEELSSGR